MAGDSNARVALVTGGGRGIGRAISLALARDGIDVAVNYRRDKEAADQTVDEIRALGRRAQAYGAAVESHDDDVAMVADVARDFGGFSILINNAGIASRGNTIAETDPAEFQRVMSVHAFGPAYLSMAALPWIRREERGDIIMISSVATKLLSPRSGPYNMAKVAMEALAFTLAKEERVHGVRTNIVRPSLTVTEMGKRLMKAAAGVQDIHDLDSSYPYGHVSTPEEVANVVAFLVSDANTYVNGETVSVDGGGR